MVDVRYRPGAPTDSWRAAVSGETIAVLPPSITAHTAEAVWRRLAAGGIAALIEALTGAFGTSLTAIPPFALATVEAGGVRVAVRGPIELIVEGDSGTEAVSGAGVATWVERLIPGTHRVTLALAGDMDDATSLPLIEGVAPIAAVVLTAGPAPARPVAAPAPTAADVSADAGIPDAAELATADDPPIEAPQADDPQADDPQADDPQADDPQADAPTAPEAPAAPEDVPAAEAAPAPATAAAAENAPAAEDVPAAEAVPTPEAAQAPAAESASVAEAGHASAASEAVGVDTWLPTATAAPTDDEIMFGATVARPPAATPTAPMPEAVPPMPPLPPLAPVAGGAPAPALGDHDGETVAVAEMRKLRDSDREKLESTDSVPMRRPTKGRIRLSTGRVVELERPVVIGRRPKSTRTTDADLPTLIAVESPDQDISRSHVEIRAEGEHVLVTDLNTTNGTVLLRGGSEPVRLHPSEPTMVVSGDILDLGDGVTVMFEDLP